MPLAKYISASELSRDLRDNHGIDLPEERIDELARMGYMPHHTCDGRGRLFIAERAKAWIDRNLISRSQPRAFPTELALIDYSGARMTGEAPPELRMLGKVLMEFPVVQLQPLTCVYFLIRAGRVVYVGRTDSLATRLVAHRNGTKNTPKKTFDRVLYILVPNPQSIDIERALIRHLKAEYNKDRNPEIPEEATTLIRDLIGDEPGEG